VTNQRGARNGQPDKTPVLSGMEASNGQAGTSTSLASDMP
jgi:hypothetical protein